MSKAKRLINNGMGHMKSMFSPKMAKQTQQQSGRSKSDKPWLDLQYHDSSRTSIKKPHELENEMQELPSSYSIDEKILDRIQGSMVGMALGDALGAHVEFRPHQYMLENPVTDLEGGGTWGLQKGQFTDDTSMALCLANSLVVQSKFNPYDQLVRYKWWYRSGYMSSTGECFDIGAATSQSLNEFELRQKHFAKQHDVPVEHIDHLSDEELLKQFDVYCSEDGVAGNGALMRLAPVPLFFYRFPLHAVEYSGFSGQITHGDTKAYDACRYYGALIVAALLGYKKEEILDKQFYSKHKHWFNKTPLCTEVKSIAEGSYQKKGGYNDGIRGKGYIVNALEAALWAFWSDKNSFEKGALAAVNLGDDTDTTAAIYGQLAGAYYGYKKLPQHWVKYVYAKKFMLNLSKWIIYEGDMWHQSEGASSFIPISSFQPPIHEMFTKPFIVQPNPNIHLSDNESLDLLRNSPEYRGDSQTDKHQNRTLRSTASESSQNHLRPPESMNRQPFEHHHMDLHSICQPQAGGMNTKSSLTNSNSQKQSSTTQKSILPHNPSQFYETPTAKSNIHEPILHVTQPTSSQEQSVASSTHTRSQASSIYDDKKSQPTSKLSSHVRNVKTLLKKAGSDSYSIKNASSAVPSSSIPVKSSKPVSPSANSGSGHKFSDILRGRKGSNSPALLTQAASTTANGSNRSGLPTDSNVNCDTTKDYVPHEQSPRIPKSTQPCYYRQSDEPTQNEKPPTGANKKNSDAQMSTKGPKEKSSYLRTRRSRNDYNDFV